MKGLNFVKRKLILLLSAAVILILLISGCALFEDEQTAKGRKLYNHYCQHCHGETGRQNEGYNWARMPDPRPRDLSDEATMSTFGDEELFHAISRKMRDTSNPEVLNDENYFAVATMPTFKYTLSELEIWSIIGYVRTLHGMSLTFDVESRRSEIENNLKQVEEEYNQAKEIMDQAQQKYDAAEEAAYEAEDEGIEFDENSLLDEKMALEKAMEIFAPVEAKYEEAKKEWEWFSKRPKMKRIPRPDLSVSDEEKTALEEKGKHLYRNTYGCHGCHSINDEGGIVGPALDRAGFRLNDTWIYQWIRYPQGIKKHTRMPNLGIPDNDGRALTAYLETLRAPKSDKPVPPPK